MFRAQQNAFDDVIAKATDENLTSENWEYMMDAWEKINESGENGPRDAAAALIKRLAHRNANVQLYTLELANAFSQNCGPRMHRELASRSFTDALLRLAGDRNTHQAVKAKILELVAEWSEMFSKDTDLGIMEQAYRTLKSQNPNLQPPSKPHKREITDVDRQKEEEELQMALAISLKERQTAAAAAAAAAGPSGSGKSRQTEGPGQAQSQTQPQAQASQPIAPSPQTTAATVSRVRALFDFVPTEVGELAFKKGDVIAVLESVYKDWWKGSLRGQVGIFPLNYVEKLADPTPDELRREAQTEAEVFAEIKNVEKLLALLSTSSPETNVQDSEEITALYHSTLAIRPKLIELIGKYSQKKDDFVSLNEKFIKARRDYEALLETSLSGPAAAPYGRLPASQPPYAYGGDGYAPPGGQPQRFYTPGPGENPVPSSHNAHAAYHPPSGHQSKPAGLPYPSPSTAGNSRRQNQQPYPNIPDGPDGQYAPYHIVGHNQHPPGDYPPSGPSQRPTSAQHHDSNASAVETHNQPQELATSVYDSPLGDRPPHGGSFHHTPSSKISEGRVSPSQPPYGGYYPYQAPPNLSVGTTNTIPTSLKPASSDITPVSPPNSHTYPQLGQGGAGHPPSGYGGAGAGYGPPPSHAAPAPPSSSGPSGGPQDYYRPSNSNAELFLPQGNRT